MTKILFINCINENRNRPVETCYSSLGTAYIASYVRKYGGFSNIEIMEIGQSFNSELLEKRNPDVVGVSSVTQNFNIAKEIAAKIKTELDVPIIMGGHHISALPNNLTEYMDVAVLGEGEQTFLELLEAYEENGLHKSKLAGIDGLAFRSDEKLVFTPRRDCIKPLDRIPFPARDLLPPLKSFYMFTSRGCPYQCMFCSSAFFWKGIRYFSAEYVVNEVKELVERYGATFINLYDDLFIANKERVKAIVRLIRNEGLHEKVEFACLARANLVTEDIACLLKRMNVKTVSLGLESGSERLLNYLKKGAVTVAQNARAVETLKKYRFTVNASFIIGSPTETKEESLETLNFLKGSKLDGGETYVLLPFPGTELWDYGVREGLLKEDMNWDDFEIYFESDSRKRVVLANKITRAELQNILCLFSVEWSRRARIRMLKGKRAWLHHPATMLKILVKKS